MFQTGKYTYQIENFGRTEKITITVSNTSESTARSNVQNMIYNIPPSGTWGYYHFKIYRI